MVQIFPNTYIAFRLLLTIPIANCKTERPFNAYKGLKTCTNPQCEVKGCLLCLERVLTEYPWYNIPASVHNVIHDSAIV